MSASVLIPISFGHIKEFITLLPTPWKRKCNVFVRTTRLHFILLFYFFLPVICLKTPSKCAAEG